MKRIIVSVLLAVPLIATAVWPAGALAATAPRLGTTVTFATMAGSTITNTGSTVITGDLGLSPGTAVTGFPPGVVNGVQHVTDAVAGQAQTDLVTAYNDAAGATVTSDLSGTDLGNRTLTPGVYHYSTSAQLTGPLTLDGQGTTNAVFIFQIGSTLTTASGSSVILINGAGACAVFWQVTSSATLGTATSFQGTIMALSSITMTTGANIVSGRALARNAALTLDTNSITVPPASCVTAAATPTPTASATPTPTPSPTASATPTPTPTAAPTATPSATAAATAAPTTPPSVIPASSLPSTGVPLAVLGLGALLSGAGVALRRRFRR